MLLGLASISNHGAIAVQRYFAVCRASTGTTVYMYYQTVINAVRSLFGRCFTYIVATPSMVFKSVFVLWG